MRNTKFDLGEVAIPSWLKQVNPHSTLSVKDMAQLFGVTEKFIHTLMAQGRLPRPEIDTNYLFGKPANQLMGCFAKNSKKLQWRVGAVIKLISDERKAQDK